MTNNDFAFQKEVLPRQKGIDQSEVIMNKYKLIYSVSWVTDGDPQAVLRGANGNAMLKGDYNHRYAFGHSTVILCVNNIPIMNLGQGATMVAAEVKKNDEP